MTSVASTKTGGTGTGNPASVADGDHTENEERPGRLAGPLLGLVGSSLQCYRVASCLRLLRAGSCCTPYPAAAPATSTPGCSARPLCCTSCRAGCRTRSALG